MPLVLTLTEGDAFFVDDSRVVLVQRDTAAHAVIECDGVVYDLVDDQAVEILDDVRLSLAEPIRRTNVRVRIEAPPEIKIVREAHYREASGDPLSSI